MECIRNRLSKKASRRRMKQQLLINLGTMNIRTCFCCCYSSWSLALILVLLVCAEASSPWNQAGLNLIFKQDLINRERLKDSDKSGIKGAGGSSGSDSSSLPVSRDVVQVKNPSSHSWGYTKYGKDIGHIRHLASRKKQIPSNFSVPCPRDYVKLSNGRCRRIPKFSSSRVG